MVPWHDVSVVTATHLVLLMVVAAISLVIVVTIRTLEVASVVLIPLMLHREVAAAAWNVVLVHHLTIALGLVVRRVERVGTTLLVGHASLVDLEG